MDVSVNFPIGLFPFVLLFQHHHILVNLLLYIGKMSCVENASSSVCMSINKSIVFFTLSAGNIRRKFFSWKSITQNNNTKLEVVFA